MYSILIILLLVVVLHPSVVQTVNSIVSEDSRNATVIQQPQASAVKKHKWIQQLFQEAMISFNLNDDVSDNCKRDYNTYQVNLENQTIWAIRMMESSEWPGMSLFAGVTTSLGNWEECLRSRGPANIQGRYCLADATYDYQFAKAAPIPHGWDVFPPENASAWEVIKMYDKIKNRKSRRSLTWAICIPSSCQHSDLESALNKNLIPIFEQNEMNIEVVVDPIKCQVETENTYPPFFYYTLLFIAFLLLLVITSSIHDSFRKISNTNNCTEGDNSCALVKLFNCFSVIQNWKLLWRQSSNEHSVLHIYKALGIFSLVVGHIGLFSYRLPQLETENAETIYKPFNVRFGLHGIIEVFMLTSGFLTFHHGLQPTKKYGIKYIISTIIIRWLRLFPTMGMVLLLFVNIMPYLGDGPLFNTYFLNEIRYCSKNWWTNLLAINNIVNRKEMCLPSTWYIAADFQLTILAGVLLIVLSKNYRLGIISIILSIAAGLVISAYVIVNGQLSGFPFPVIIHFGAFRKMPGFSDYHVQMFPRIGPYLLGGLSALMLNKLKEMKWKPSMSLIFSLVILSSIGLVFQLYGFLLLQVDRPYFVIENMLYGILHKTFFVLPFVTVYILLSLRRIPIISDILEWRVILPLSRLCYGVYLVSVPIQFFYLSTVRQILDGSKNMQVFWRSSSDILCSLLAAAILFYISEGPIINLIHVLQQSILNKLENSRKISLKSTKHNLELHYDKNKDKSKTL